MCWTLYIQILTTSHHHMSNLSHYNILTRCLVSGLPSTLQPEWLFTMWIRWPDSIIPNFPMSPISLGIKAKVLQKPSKPLTSYLSLLWPDIQPHHESLTSLPEHWPAYCSPETLGTLPLYCPSTGCHFWLKDSFNQNSSHRLLTSILCTTITSSMEVNLYKITTSYTPRSLLVCSIFLQHLLLTYLTF